MYKYLRESEYNTLKDGIDKILALRMLIEDKEVDEFSKGNTSYRNAKNIYKRIKKVGRRNYKLVNISDEGQSYSELMVEYFNKGNICSKEEYMNFDSMYSTSSTTATIIDINEIVNSYKFELFYNGKMTFKNAIKFFERLMRVDENAVIFKDSIKVFSNYCEKEFKDIIINSEEDLKRYISKYDADTCSKDIIKCAILSNSFNSTVLEMVNFNEIYNLTYSELKNMLKFINSNEFYDYFDRKLTIRKAREVYEKIREDIFLELICPTYRMVMYSYLENITGIDYDSITEACYDNNIYGSDIVRQEYEDELLVDVDPYDREILMTNSISLITDKIINRKAISAKYFDLASSDGNLITGFEVFKDIREYLSSLIDISEVDDSDSFSDLFYDTMGTDATAIAIKDFKCDKRSLLDVDRQIPQTENVLSQIYSDGNNTFIILSDEIMFYGLPINTMIEFVFLLFDAAKVNIDM